MVRFHGGATKKVTKNKKKSKTLYIYIKMKTTLRHMTANYCGSNKPVGAQSAIWFTGLDREIGQV